MATRRIAINLGSGFVPGLDAIVTGVALAGRELGWEMLGIRDGYDGLLDPDRYPDGGVVTLDAREPSSSGHGGSVLGTAARCDPFRMRTTTAEHDIEETDRSGDLLAALGKLGVDGVVSVVGGSVLTGQHALSVAFRLHRRGLRTVCVPKSVENDIAGVPLPFGYNSVLSHAVETLGRIRTAARDSGRLAVVELPGQHAGWLALQSGMATLADAVLLPEVPYDIGRVAASLADRERAGKRPALVVVAEGARPVAALAPALAPDPLRASLTPNADPELGEGAHIIDRSGGNAKAVAAALERLLDRSTLPIAYNLLVRAAAPTALDRQLGLAYGAAAVRALARGENGVLLTFQAPDVRCIPLTDALNRVRTVPADSEFVQVARALGVVLGD